MYSLYSIFTIIELFLKIKSFSSTPEKNSIKGNIKIAEYIYFNFQPF